jgi:hypothetical protein
VSTHGVILMLVCMAVATRTMQAQLSDRDTAGLRITASLTGSVSTGTVDRTLVMGGLDVSARAADIGMRTTNTYTYGTFGSATTERDVLSRTFLYAWPTSSVYPYVMLWCERGIRRSIDVRVQPGLGATWRAWQDSAFSVKVSATLSHDATTFMRALEVGAISTARWRGIARCALQYGTAHGAVQADLELWTQPALDDHTDRRTFVDAMVSVRIWNDLRLRGAMTYLDEPHVPRGTSRHDLFATIGLSYTIHP